MTMAINSGLSVCLGSSYFGHYAHAGFLNGLDQSCLTIECLSGSSAGALAGGLWAAGLRGEALQQELVKTSFRRAFLDPSAMLRLPGIATWSYASGILGGGRLRKLITQLIGDRSIEQLMAPRLEIAVANLTRQRGEIRTSGPLVDFIIASLSMPLVFKVSKINGERFLDGGVSNQLPFAHWLNQETIGPIVIHQIHHTQAKQSKAPMNAPWVIANCHSVANADLELLRDREAENSGKRIIRVTTNYPHPGILHGRRRAEEMYYAGYETAVRLSRSHPELSAVSAAAKPPQPSTQAAIRAAATTTKEAESGR